MPCPHFSSERCKLYMSVARFIAKSVNNRKGDITHNEE